MAGDWQPTTLGEICKFRAGAVFKPELQGRGTGEYPFAKVSDMNLPANGVKLQEANHWVSKQDLVQLKAKPLPAGAVVFAKIGEALRQNRLRQTVRETLVDNNMMGAVPDLDRVDPAFFYYALSQFDFANIAQGTALPYLTISALSALKLDLPNKPEQHFIAELLGALDDKIELNRRMAETLEAMAQALFKSWFVDFEPVHAKAERRTIGLPDGVAALFPDSFGEDGLPQEWIEGTIADLATVNPTTPLKTEAAPYIDMAALPTSGPRITRVLQRAPGSGARFRNGDTLIARITPCLENGKTALVDCLDGDAAGWGSTEFIVLRPNADTPRALPYLLARHPPFREALIAAMSGTSGRQRVQGDAVTRWPLAIPTKPVLQAFQNTTNPIFSRITQLGNENAELTDLRDTLLPKIISGELRIADAEKKVSAA